VRGGEKARGGGAATESEFGLSLRISLLTPLPPSSPLLTHSLWPPEQFDQTRPTAQALAAAPGRANHSRTHTKKTRTFVLSLPPPFPLSTALARAPALRDPAHSRTSCDRCRAACSARPFARAAESKRRAVTRERTQSSRRTRAPARLSLSLFLLVAPSPPICSGYRTPREEPPLTRALARISPQREQ
jgi:hypothetical protein